MIFPRQQNQTFSKMASRKAKLIAELLTSTSSYVEKKLSATSFKLVQFSNNRNRQIFKLTSSVQFIDLYIYWYIINWGWMEVGTLGRVDTFEVSLLILHFTVTFRVWQSFISNEHRLFDCTYSRYILLACSASKQQVLQCFCIFGFSIATRNTLLPPSGLSDSQQNQ